jgi:hypothetical protein
MEPRLAFMVEYGAPDSAIRIVEGCLCLLVNFRGKIGIVLIMLRQGDMQTPCKLYLVSRHTGTTWGGSALAVRQLFV